MPDTTDTGGEFASSPCFAHELAETADGFAVTDPQTATDVARWRKAERERLLAARKAMSRSDRDAATRSIAARLDSRIEFRPGLAVSVYWPIRGEPDLRDWMRSLVKREITVLLPVITEKATPIRFFSWTPESRMVPGFWNIPVPENGTEGVPDVSIVPLVGFDADRYRLGYGGGYFDRTLASLKQRPKAFGIGYTSSEVPSIFPQPHDIAMDDIVTA